MQLIAVLLLVVVSVSAYLDLDSQVSKGREAKDNEFPYHIGLYFWVQEMVIAADVECIDTIPTIKLGSVDLERGTERRARNKTIKSISLPPFSHLNETYEGHTAIVLGWGYTIGSFKTVLMYEERILTENNICTADPDGFADCLTLSDSGGPLVDMHSGNYTVALFTQNHDYTFLTDKLSNDTHTCFYRDPQFGLYRWQRADCKDIFQCGGTLISKKFVLTAAHCIDELKVNHITVLLGSIHLNQGTERRARNKTVHPGYVKGKDQNNIGIVEILPIRYSDTCKNIDLPPLSDTSTYDGKIATVSGWGYTNGSVKVADILQFTDLMVISNEACNDPLIEVIYGAVTDDMICAADPNSSTICRFDSGGPLVDKDSRLLIGIISFIPSDECGSIDKQPAFSRITFNRKWIKEQTEV